VPAATANSVAAHLAAGMATVGAGAVLSDSSAAWCFGLPLPLGVSPIEPVHVTIQAPRRLRHQRNLTIHTRNIAGRVVQARGFAVTDPVRTWLDLANRHRDAELVAITDSMLHQQLATEAELAAAVLSHYAHPGARNAAFALELADGRAESWWETVLRLALIEADLPVTPQVEIRDAAGGLIARSDLGIPELRIAIEFDDAHHFTETQQRADVRRVQLMQRQDWIVLRYTAADITRRLPQTIAEIRLTVSARASRAA
jgi:very-short-patch-repair endonuclease